MTEVDEIRALCRRLSEAHAERDADAIVDCFAPDALVYGLAPPLGQRGMDRAAIVAWLDTWEGPLDIEAADSEVVAEGDVGFVTGLNRMRGRKRDGETVDLWFRTTLGLRRIEGRWLIVHDHSSVPFYMDGSYRACTDLRPE